MNQIPAKPGKIRESHRGELKSQNRLDYFVCFKSAGKILVLDLIGEIGYGFLPSQE